MYNMADHRDIVPVTSSTCLPVAPSMTYMLVTPSSGSSSSNNTSTIVSRVNSISSWWCDSSSRPRSSLTETTPRRYRCAGPPVSRARRWCVYRRLLTPWTRRARARARCTATSLRRPTTTFRCRLHHHLNRLPHLLASAHSVLASSTSTRCPSSSTAAALTWKTMSPLERRPRHFSIASWTRGRLELSVDGLQALVALAVNLIHRCSANTTNNILIISQLTSTSSA